MSDPKSAQYSSIQNLTKYQLYMVSRSAPEGISSPTKLAALILNSSCATI